MKKSISSVAMLIIGILSTQILNARSIFDCARSGKLEEVKALVEKGANINSTDKAGRSVLYWAAAYGNREITDYLLDQGAQVPSANGQRLLINSMLHGMTKLFTRLMEDKPDVLQKNPYSLRTNLFHASMGGDPIIMKRLIRAGLKANDSDRYGWTTLHCANDKDFFFSHAPNPSQFSLFSAP